MVECANRCILELFTHKTVALGLESGQRGHSSASFSDSCYDMNVFLIGECLFIFGKTFDYEFHFSQLFNMSMPGILHKGRAG